MSRKKAKPSVVITYRSDEPRPAASLHKKAPPIVNMQTPTLSLCADQATAGQLLASPGNCPLILLQGFPLSCPLASGQCCCQWDCLMHWKGALKMTVEKAQSS